MAQLNVKLTGKGIIDNAVIYLEDPLESTPYYLEPNTETEWESEVQQPVDGELDYSLHVVAFSGTRFTCVITNMHTAKKIEFSGVTGRLIANRANIKGSQIFS